MHIEVFFDKQSQMVLLFIESKADAEFMDAGLVKQLGLEMELLRKPHYT